MSRPAWLVLALWLTLLAAGCWFILDHTPAAPDPRPLRTRPPR